MSASRLAETVIEGGYCIGCGACASLDGSPLRMELDELGRFQAVLDPAAPADNDAVLAVCPFSEAAADEDELAAALYPALAGHDAVGRHLATYAGHALHGRYREQGSSGGLTSWVLARLLETATVDAVVHVRPDVPGTDRDPLFRYTVSRSVSEVTAAAKSRYHPVELSEVIATVRDHPARYAVVGVPCFVKAVQLLRRQDPVLAERIVVTVGLVCGHLKSRRFAEYIAWQTGIAPAELEAIDFRHKLLDRPANRYGACVVGRRGDPERVVPMEDLEGGDWGLGYFKYHACDYCDDVLAETADVTFGDAWLPEYVTDAAGTNVVVVRDPAIDELLRAGATDGAVALTPLDADRVALSQRSGLRHRRDGLAYRLALADRRGRWRPPKRVAPRTDHLSRRERRIFRLRIALAARSHVAFLAARRRAELSVFQRRMARLVRAYDRAYGRRPWRRHVWRARNVLRRITRIAR